MRNKTLFTFFSFLFVLSFSGLIQSQSVLTHNTTRLQASVFHDGYVGHRNEGLQGNGVRFLTAVDAMYTAGIMLGTQASGVRGMVGSFVSATGQPPLVGDMVNVTTYTGFSSNPFFNQIATCVFNEAPATPNRLGVNITQTSYSNTNDDFVFVAYTISNPTASAINGLYVGMFADWDVGLNNYLFNRGGLDQPRNMLYQWEQNTTPADPNYYGIVALSGLAGGTTTWLFPGDNLTIRDSLFSWISSIRTPDPIVEDHRMFIGSGPFNIPASGNILVGFALVAGANLTNLQVAADQAQVIWNSIILPVELTSFSASVSPGGSVELKWSTSTEINNRVFEIERRTSEGTFATIGFVDGAGTTTQPRDYSYVDNTVTRGTYQYRLKQVDFDGRYEYSDVVEVEVLGPLTFELSQNYPNPFNPSTTIKYSIAEAGNIKLAVYNLVGEQIMVIDEGFKEAGFYEVAFDASGLSSGTYFYRLESASNVQTRKMILMK